MILIIDNYPFGSDVRERHKRFKEALKDFETETVSFEKVKWNELEKYDGFILSGSDLSLRVGDNIKRYLGEIEFIGRTSKPVLGICFGHQLIGVAFGFKIRKMLNGRNEWGEEITLKIKPFELCNKESITVQENHFEEIEHTAEFDKFFEILSSDKDCKIEAMRHKEKPIFGVQFHPEATPDFRVKEDGEEILKRFASICSRKPF